MKMLNQRTTNNEQRTTRVSSLLNPLVVSSCRRGNSSSSSVSSVSSVSSLLKSVVASSVVSSANFPGAMGGGRPRPPGGRDGRPPVFFPKLRGENPPSSSPLLITHYSLFIENPARRRGFTLIELLVVISIIAILIAILLPALAGALNAGYSASTEAELGAVKAACLSYYSSFNAYPGPFSEADIAAGITVAGNRITGTQNLLLGLMGTVYPSNQPPPPASVLTFAYSGSTTGAPSGYVMQTLGSGPIDYSNNGIQKAAYYNPAGADLQTSPPTAAGATPTQLPTLYDDFPNGVPILYFRKVPGMPGASGYPVGLDSGTAAAFYLNCNSAYTTPTGPSPNGGSQYILTTKNNSQTSEQYSSYNPNSSNGTPQSQTYAINSLAAVVVNQNVIPAGTPVNTPGNPVQGGFVLISAGADHIYGQNMQGIPAGTQPPASDDIVVFGGQ